MCARVISSVPMHNTKMKMFFFFTLISLVNIWLYASACVCVCVCVCVYAALHIHMSVFNQALHHSSLCHGCQLNAVNVYSAVFTIKKGESEVVCLFMQPGDFIPS